MRKNNQSLLVGGIGQIMQFAGLITWLLQLEVYGFSRMTTADIVVIIGLIVVGTAMIIWGLSLFARAKGLDPKLGWLGLFSILGVIAVAARPDEHLRAKYNELVKANVADLPDEGGVVFRCLRCEYQLNGTPGRSCPECGTPFDPNDKSTVAVGGVGLGVAPWMGRWSLICGIIGILLSAAVTCGPILSLAGIGFGHSALMQIKRKMLPGLGVAVAGLVLSYLALALTIGMFYLIYLG